MLIKPTIGAVVPPIVSPTAPVSWLKEKKLHQEFMHKTLGAKNTTISGTTIKNQYFTFIIFLFTPPLHFHKASHQQYDYPALQKLQRLYSHLHKAVENGNW